MAAVDYVITARAVRQGAFVADPGPVKFLRVPADVNVPTPDLAATSKTDINNWMKEVQGLADGDQNPLSISPTGDVLIFVHGYNNDLDIIMKRQRQLTADLTAEGWRGVVIAFDWPSNNFTLNYWEDRSDAAA